MGFQGRPYDKEIIRRTILLIESYEGEYNLTLFLNSLYTLICLPQQYGYNINNGELDRLIRDIPELTDLIDPNNDFYLHEQNQNFRTFLRRIRNGISHHYISPIDGHMNDWEGIYILDYPNHTDYSNNTNLKLRVRFTHKQLKDFAAFVSSKYLLNEL